MLDIAEGNPVAKCDAIMVGGKGYDVLQGADMIINTAGVPRKKGPDGKIPTREQLLAVNLAVTQKVSVRGTRRTLFFFGGGGGGCTVLETEGCRRRCLFYCLICMSHFFCLSLQVSEGIQKYAPIKVGTEAPNNQLPGPWDNR